MRDAREPTGAVRLRVLRRRVLLGTVAVLGLFFSLWQAWDLESRLFFELLLGSVVMVAGMAVIGAGLAWLIGWLRSKKNR